MVIDMNETQLKTVAQLRAFLNGTPDVQFQSVGDDMQCNASSAKPAWRGNLLIGGLSSQALVRLVLDGQRVTGEERIPMGARIRDVRQGPDGAIYLLTDQPNGEILRLTPAGTGRD